MKLIPYRAENEQERDNAYPINKMRNVGLDECNTSHVLLIDADFIPSDGLDVGIQKAVRLTSTTQVTVTDAMDVGMQRKRVNTPEEEYRRNRHFHALVVPAYERKLESSPCTDLEDCLKLTSQNSEFMPTSMASLSKCVQDDDLLDEHRTPDSSKCIVFHSDHFPKGHGNTESDAWLKGMDEETVRSIPCISDGYEPYVVIPWCPMGNENFEIKEEEEEIDAWAPLSPYYDERFYGYGKNKIQQVLHLRAKGYEFAVIPALGFLTHHPHPISTTRKIWNVSKTEGQADGTPGLHTKMESLFQEYKAELKQEYDGKVRVWTKFCPKKVLVKVRRRRKISVPLVLGLGLLLLILVVRKKRELGGFLTSFRSKMMKSGSSLR